VIVRYVKKMAANFDAIKYIESKVNLDSYSSTDGFIGYCNSSVGWGDERCIEAFIEMLALLVPKEVVVSSIRIYGDLKSHAELYELSEEEVLVRDRLIKGGLILNVATDEESEAFHFEGIISKDTLKYFVLYQSSIGELSYHGFVTNAANELIIYPHDDCGLGFISCNSKSKQQVIDRIKECSKRYSDILEFTLVE
jgi:hypothetical protein